VPQEVSEISSGQQFSRSSSEGQLADTQTRVFRILRSSIDEIVDIQAACDVRIGDRHPYNDNLYCVSFDARFEGDSRMVVAATFNYQTTASAASSSGGADPRSQAPDVRPANWTTSTSLMEMPARVWRVRQPPRAAIPPLDDIEFPLGRPAQGEYSDPVPAVNPVGDIYDGVTALTPVVTISITQYDQTDPTRNLQYAGSVNAEIIRLGNLEMAPGTVLFRGVSYQPTIESWGGRTFRGWTATYEFAYRRNPMTVNLIDNIKPGWQLDPFGNPLQEPQALAPAEIDAGWSIAVPVTGYNVKARIGFVGDEDNYAQPLKHGEEGSEFDGRIVEPIALPDGVDVGDRVRAMVRVFSYNGGGASQVPSAAAVALKMNGSALKTHNENGSLINQPIIMSCQTQPLIDLTQTLGLRLQ